MKRIGIDGHMIGDHSGGNESYCSNILQSMDFANTDIEAILFLKEGVDAKAYDKKFKIIRFKSKNPFVRNFIEIPKLCMEYKLDLLHMQYFIPFCRPCPVVCSIYDICFEHYKNIFTKKEYLRQKVLVPYAAKKSEAIFTISQYSRKDLEDVYSIPDEKIYIAYCAVSKIFHKLEKAELKEKELREKYHIGEERFLLCVGNLQPRKNLPRLIRAFRQYKLASLSKDKLVIVGKKAWMYDDILKTVLEGTNDVILTDYVSETDLVRLYNAAHAFIYPSYYEGFGIPPLEALACKTPVAVANATSLPEVVGDAGIYFDPFDEDDIEKKIDKIMNNDKVRSNGIYKSSERIDYFSWKRSADTIINTYKALLE